jgi:hypothetical protein
MRAGVTLVFAEVCVAAQPGFVGVAILEHKVDGVDAARVTTDMGGLFSGLGSSITCNHTCYDVAVIFNTLKPYLSILLGPLGAGI